MFTPDIEEQASGKMHYRWGGEEMGRWGNEGREGRAIDRVKKEMTIGGRLSGRKVWDNGGWKWGW